MPSLQPPAVRRIRAGDTRNTKGKMPPAIKRELDWLKRTPNVNRSADKYKRKGK